MRAKKIALLVTAFICASVILSAQEKPGNSGIMETAKKYYPESDTAINAPDMPLALIAEHYGDHISLRWAPKGIEGWILGMKYGYRIDRVRLNDSLEIAGQWDTLYTGLKKPYSIDKFKAEIKAHPGDDYLAAAAESLYGYQLEHGPKVEKSEAFELAEEFKDRFVICLLSADLSANAAEGLGWRLDDKKIMPKQTYLYRVFIPGNDTSAFKYDNTVIVTYNPKRKEAVPYIEKVEEKERQVDLLLPREYNKRFTAFKIERSGDGGKSWQSLTDAPFVQPLTDNPIGNYDYIVYRDTGLVNYRPYRYRVRGYTPFGKLSKPSPVVKGMGRDRTPPLPPDSLKVVMNYRKEMEITWYYNDPPRDIKGFILGKSKKPFGKIIKVHDGELPPKTRKFVDKSPYTIHNNYYTLFVIDTAGNVAYSRSVYGAYIDEEPPAPPKNIKYTIDTNGIVKLTWPMGKEEDLMGYHVYFSNSKTQYPVNVTNQVLQDTVFTDTIDLRALHKKVYYRVTALDLNYNVSHFSDWVVVEKPDLVPPAAPLIVAHKGLKAGIRFDIKKSHSNDVKAYLLERFDEKSSRWKVIKTVPAFAMRNTIEDSSSELVKGKLYRYRLRAKDHAGNISEVAYTYTARTLLEKPTGDITRFDIVPRKRKAVISWEFTGHNDDIMRIYRLNAQGKWVLIQSVDAAKRQSNDYTVKEEKTYSYKLRLLSRSGAKLDDAGPKKVLMKDIK